MYALFSAKAADAEFAKENQVLSSLHEEARNIQTKIDAQTPKVTIFYVLRVPKNCVGVSMNIITRIPVSSGDSVSLLRRNLMCALFSLL